MTRSRSSGQRPRREGALVLGLFLLAIAIEGLTLWLFTRGM